MDQGKWESGGFICLQNSTCYCLSTKGKTNDVTFYCMFRRHICSLCGEQMQCGTQKFVEFDNNIEHANVYHVGGPYMFAQNKHEAK